MSSGSSEFPTPETRAREIQRIKKLIETISNELNQKSVVVSESESELESDENCAVSERPDTTQAQTQYDCLLHCTVVKVWDRSTQMLGGVVSKVSHEKECFVTIDYDNGTSEKMPASDAVRLHFSTKKYKRIPKYVRLVILTGCSSISCLLTPSFNVNIDIWNMSPKL